MCWSQTAVCAGTKGKKLHFWLPEKNFTMHSVDLKEEEFRFSLAYFH
jgi:hypothetical protein